MAGVDCCDFVVGGPASASLSGADGGVDLAGNVTDTGVASLANLAGSIAGGVTFLTDPVGVASPDGTYQETAYVRHGLVVSVMTTVAVA